MKQTILILSGLVLFGLVYSYQLANGEDKWSPQTSTTDYIVIKYAPATNQDVVVYSGANQVQRVSLSKEQRMDFGTINLVIDLMNKYSSEGYMLVSTHTDAIGTQCFLRKTK